MNGRIQKLEVVDGDITGLDVEAIVNAANRHLAPGAGVCGAIHRAAGPDLARACAAVGSCEPGDAKLTPGFNLKARYVIHAVGPVWRGGDKGEDQILARCYRFSLSLAAAHDVRSIAFPAISTGVYGYPLERAADVAVAAVREWLPNYPVIERVVFCCFGAEPAAVYRRLLGEIGA
jgi:O-acetyl-ADP-ribose deacetylase